jgi:hypothetical protein
MDYEQKQVKQAADDVAKELGFRVKNINGQIFMVYEADQKVVPGLGGEGLIDLWKFAVRERFYRLSGQSNVLQSCNKNVTGRV